VLSDENRNKTYWNALQGCDLKGKRVLVLEDQVLALFAVKAGADKVYICNPSESMLIKNNKKIIILKKKIYNCTSKDFNNKKVHVVLSEWMGICLFHKRRLESVIYARDKFLIKKGLMMPSKAILYVSLIENNEKREENDDDLEFWKTNGQNHDQNFKDLYDIDISEMHKHAVKDFYTHIIAQRVLTKNIISNTVLHEFDLMTIKKKDLKKINLPATNFKILKDTLLAGICFHFTIEFSNFQGDHVCTLTTEPGVYNHWKQGVAYFSKLLPIEENTECDLEIMYEINDETSFNIKCVLIIDNNRYIKLCNTNTEYI
jgi:protein arginine N-methyltransferase 1